MHFFVVALLICFFIFLFSLYLLARDDFVLTREDVTLDRIFNIAFIAFAVSILSSRILYTLSNPSTDFLNPLVFLLFPYFPGLSLAGGVGGGVLFLLIFCKHQKFPAGRILDFFSISFLSALPVGIVGYFLLERQSLLAIEPISLILVYVALFFIFIKILLPRLLSGALKGGTIGFIFLIIFAVISFVSNLLSRGKNLLNLGLEDLVLIILFYTFLVFLFRQEKILEKIKKFKWKKH